MNNASHIVSEYLDDCQQVLAVAALFNGSFSVDWVQELGNFKTSQILLALGKGVKDGLLEQGSSVVYSFVDTLRREALRETFAHRERERMHRSIVNIILREAPDEAMMTKEVTGQFLQISNDMEGCRWLFRAGNAHLNAFGRIEALKCFAKVVEDLERLNSEEADQLYIDAAIKFAKASVASDKSEAVVEVLNKAIIRARKRDDVINQVHLAFIIGKFAFENGRYDEHIRHVERGRMLASTIHDPRLQQEVTIYNIITKHGWGRYAEAAKEYYGFMPEIDRYPRGWFAQLAGISLAACLASAGYISQGMGMLDRIRTHSLKMGNFSIASEAGMFIGQILLDMHRIDEALEYLNQALVDSIQGQQLIARNYILLTLAYGHFLNGDIDESVSHFNEHMKVNQHLNLNSRNIAVYLHLTWAMEEGRYPSVHNMCICDEIAQSIESLNFYEKGIAYRYKALLDRKNGLASSAVMDSLERSQDWLLQSGHQTELARTRLEIGRQHLAAGEVEKAKAAVRAAAEYLSTIDIQLIPRDLLHLTEHLSFEKCLLDEIFKLGKEVVSIRDNKRLVQHIICTVNRITGAERGAIFLLDQSTNELKLVLRASKTLMTEDITRPDFRKSMELMNQTAATGEGRVLVFDHNAEFGPADARTIRACICVPLILKDKVIGVLYHDNRIMNNSFKESDLAVLSLFAGLAAIALDNANAYEEVRRLNQRLIEEKQYYEELDLESVHYEDLVGKSKGIIEVLAKVGRVAETETTVLILGETGVGKELVARAIHRSSPRSDKPFIRVNCSALPESLISSELFGHEKGSFTGAIRKRTGRFELADGGTLFLDEIGELPLEVQVRLLRVLQSHEFERVGGSKTLRSDFRLIVATNRDLEHEVSLKRFRKDLFYRIAVFPIVVPPLRERRDDIPMLAGHFLNIYANKMGKGVVKIKNGDMLRLMDYNWPGNVRELENVIERGIILSEGAHFRLPALETRLADLPGGMEIRTLLENERRLIEYTLNRTKGRVQGPGGAAALLGINPNTLKSRIKKLGIKKP